MAKDHKGSHHTVHADLRRAIDFVRGLAGVERVVLGPTRGCSHHGKSGSLKVQGTTQAGLKLIGYAAPGVSEFFVLTKDPDGVAT